MDNIGLAILLITPLILGIARGSTLCLIACAPGILPYLWSKRYGWKKNLQLAIIFNLPRIIVLTILGIIVGIVGFTLKDWVTSALPKIFLPVQVIGYGFLGIFILIFGAHMFTSSVEAQEDMKEQKFGCSKSIKNKQSCEDKTCVSKKPGLFSSFKNRFNKTYDKPKRLFLVWGGILSIACLGEIILIELSLISGSFGVISGSLYEAALLGGAAMFLFAVGAAIPIIIVAMLANPMGQFFKARGFIENIRSVFGIAMIIIGLFFIFILIGNIALAL